MSRSAFGLCAALFLSGATLAGCGNGDPAGAVSISDDFDDNTKNLAKWGSDRGDEDGVFSERDGALEYSGGGTYLDRPWIATEFPYDSDWEVQVDIEHVVESHEIVSLGLGVFHVGDHGDRIRYELYSDSFDEQYRGFFVELWEDDFHEVQSDSDEIPDLTTGALRIRWDSMSKLLMLYYDEDSTDGYAWTFFEAISEGEEGHPAADQNVDWDMTDADRFSITIYGYVSAGDVPAGELRADNFVTVGGFRPGE
jgi:hypothetical protein